MLKIRQYIHSHLVCSFNDFRYLTKQVMILGLCTLVGCQPQQPKSGGFKPAPVYDGPQTEDRIIVDEDGQLVKNNDLSTDSSAIAVPADERLGDQKTVDQKPVGTEKLSIQVPEGYAGTLTLAIQQYDYAVKAKNSKLKKQALAMIESVFSQAGFFNPVPFNESPYYHLFLAQSHPEFMKATSGLQNTFEVQKTAIINIIRATSFSIMNLPAELGVEQALKITSDFVTEFEGRVENSPTLMPEVKNGIRDAMNERFWIKVEKAREILSQSSGSPQTFEAALKQMTQFITQFEVVLTEEEAASLKQAEGMTADLTRELTGKEALAFLINIWESMPEAERAEVFAQSSPELHEFLSSKDEKQRNCLKSKKCKGLVLRIARGLFILPKIKKIGISNIQKQISDAAIQKLNTAVNAAARTAVLDLPARLEKEIFAELDQELVRYQGYRDNYPTFLAEELGSWFELEFGKKELSFIPQNLSPKMLGLTIMAMNRWSAAMPASTKKNEIQLSLLNVLLMHGGFNTVDKKGFTSLLKSRGAQGQNQSVNLESFTLPKGRIGYLDNGNVKLTLQERQQMMRAFRELVALLQPSQVSPWSIFLDRVQVDSFFSRVDADGLKKKAFPREAFMALAVANYVAFLYDLDWETGPLFFMCPENKLAWLGKKQECEKPTTLISIADLPVSNSEISTWAHADFLNEVLEFFNFVDSIQATKNAYLKPHLKKFSQIKPQLHKLSVSLSNFLSHILIQQDGEVCARYDVNARKCIGSLNDMLAYRASLKALKNSYSYLDINAYQAVVLSSYRTMNRKYLSDKTGFYNFNKAALKRIILLNSLDIAEIAAELEVDADSKIQAEQLVRKWSQLL